MIKKASTMLAVVFVIACVAGGCAKSATTPVNQNENTPVSQPETAPEVTVPTEIVPPETVTTPETTPEKAVATGPEKNKNDQSATNKTTKAPKSAAKPALTTTTTKSTKTGNQPKAAPDAAETPAQETPEETPAEEVTPALPKATDSPMVTIAPDKVLDIGTDTGLLTVRYFLLDSEHKSGDSILIHTPEGKTILIDAGIPESGEQLTGYLKKLGITRIDVLINTHPHQDHLGGMPAVINAFEIGDYYKNPRDYTSKEYSATMAALQAKNIPVHVVAEGDVIDFGDGLKFDVYNPPKDMNPYLYSENGVFTDTTFTTQINQESLALMLTYKDVKCFFCGDLFQPGEGDLIARYPDGTFDADIVHAPHHGAASSSSTPYLTATDPLMVIMSTNGLQSLAVYEKYSGYGSVVVANSLNGNILITTDGSKESIHAYVEKQTLPEDGQPVPES